MRRAAKILYFDTQFTKFSKNIKKTWSVIREIIGSNKVKDKIPDFFKENNQIIRDFSHKLAQNWHLKLEFLMFHLKHFYQ